jgi:asparagine synthase (glutamine-hydrolysing)
MPGIFGMVSSTPRVNLAVEAAEMARRLKHFPWYQTDTHVDAEGGLALGRVGLGYINTARQPATNEDGSLLAVMAGEVFDYAEHRRALTAAGHTFASESHAELLLHGYESGGQKFFESLRGTCAAAIWDARNARLILVNDRFGMKGLYYAQLPGRLLFASEIKALLVDPEVSRRINPRGLAQWFTYSHMLGEDTLLEDVRLLPAAGWLTYDALDSRLSLDRFWRMGAPTTSGDRSPREVLDEIDTAFKQAIDRHTEGGARLGLSLSGGLDARTILGVMNPDRPVTTVSLGMEGSIDLHSAAEMSRLTGRPHRRLILDTRFLHSYEDHMRRMVHLTDGQYPSQCIVMPTLPLYRELGIEVLLRGHAGELMHMDKAYNYSLDAQAWTLHDGAALENWLFTHLRTYMLEGVGESVFAPPYRGQVDALARASLRECLQESERMDHPVNRIAHLFLYQSVRRDTSLSMMKFGSVAETRLPYLDADLVNVLFAAPPELRVGEQIQAHILRRRQPAFLKVVNANTGTRLGAGRLRRAFHTFRMKALAKLGFKGYQPYERLGKWLREELRPLVDRLLRSDRFLGRGIFEPDVVRKVLDRHLNHGHNHTYLILGMMVFELGQRQFIDGRGVAEVAPAPPAEKIMTP